MSCWVVVVFSLGVFGSARATPGDGERRQAQERLTAGLAPEGAGATLLLGLRVEDVTTFAPMYDLQKVPLDPGPGYRTLAVHHDGKTARVVADLPMLAVPEASGFGFVSEASVELDEGFDMSRANALGEALPLTYSASRLVRTRRAAAMKGAVALMRAHLSRRVRGRQLWGSTDTTSLLFITPTTGCVLRSHSAFTGGAVGFMGRTSTEVLGERPRLSDDATRAFVEAMVASGRASAERTASGAVDLDRPGRDAWRFDLAWRSDVRPCVGRHRGETWLLGEAAAHSNNWRQWAFLAPAAPAPRRLAPSSVPADVERVTTAFPDARDVFESPAGDLLVVLDGSRLVGLSHNGTVIEVDLGAPQDAVMVEWAVGAAATRWVEGVRHAARTLGASDGR